MKKHLLSYLFFTVYLFALVKPVFPILDYIVNYDYIATVLCENKAQPIMDCNGKCYVVNEIQKNTQTDHSLMPIVEFEKYIVNEFKIPQEKTIIDTNNLVIFHYLKNYNQTYYNTIFHPPIV